jgi:hypothetical protein
VLALEIIIEFKFKRGGIKGKGVKGGRSLKEEAI